MTKPPRADAPSRPRTLEGWLARAEALYAQHEVVLGQVATSAHDEALYLLLRTLGLPLESDASVLARPLDASERTAVEKVLHRRLVDRVPAAYLTREAFLGEHRFYVDERVIIPRSYFLEIISQVDRWLKKATTVTRAAHSTNPRALRSPTVPPPTTSTGCWTRFRNIGYAGVCELMDSS